MIDKSIATRRCFARCTLAGQNEASVTLQAQSVRVGQRSEAGKSEIVAYVW